MTTRDVLAGAINAAAIPATPGEVVNIAPNYRQSLDPYRGFVRLGHWARSENGFGGMDTWEIWLALPQDIAEAETWLDAHRQQLIDALAPEALVLTLTPTTLVLGTNTVPGLVIETAREG